MKREPSGSDMHLRQAFNTDLDAILQRCPSQGTVRALRHRTVRGGQGASQANTRIGVEVCGRLLSTFYMSLLH